MAGYERIGGVQVLQQFFGPLDQSVAVRVAPAHQLPGASLPAARMSGRHPGCMIACRGPANMLPHGEQDWDRIATSLPGQIWIAADVAEPGTAAGIALLGHEYQHQIQYRRIPSFTARYDQAERDRLAAGRPPYLNPFEWEAYQAEADVYKQALAYGFPPGQRVPVLIQMEQGTLRPGVYGSGAYTPYAETPAGRGILPWLAAAAVVATLCLAGRP